jgi:hypothetical protein
MQIFLRVELEAVRGFSRCDARILVGLLDRPPVTAGPEKSSFDLRRPTLDECSADDDAVL